MVAGMWAALGRMSAGRLVLFFGSAVVAGVFVVAVLVTQFGQAPYVPPTDRPASVDVSDLPAFWSSTYSKATWYGLTQVPAWDGNVLTANTSLRADADAQGPAKAICVAMSMYWVSTGKGFHSVRVLDGAGQVLVSRHTESDQCTWRR